MSAAHEGQRYKYMEYFLSKQPAIGNFKYLCAYFNIHIFNEH